MKSIRIAFAVTIVLTIFTLRANGQDSESSLSSPVSSRQIIALLQLNRLPVLSLPEATKLAERFLSNENTDLSKYYLFNATIRVSEDQPEPYWEMQWYRLRTAHDSGSDIWVRVGMTGATKQMDPPYATPKPLPTGNLSETARPVTCDNRCLNDIRSLIQMHKTGALLSWIEKANSRLGDRIAPGLAAIYPGSSLYRTVNFRWYLPILVEAFAATEGVSNPAARKADLTLALLNRLLDRTRDKYWRLEIRKTINSVMYNTGSFRPIEATGHPASSSPTNKN